MMKVLIACEFSGTVKNAFSRLGHDAYSCDLLPSEQSGKHITGDVMTVLDDGWDLMVAFPPCTHLACSGARWFKNKQKEQEEAIAFVRALLGAPIHKIALENPVGIISSRIRKPDQIVQPWMFGDPFTKTTCLWLKGLPKLIPTKIVDKGKIQVVKSGKKLPEWYSNAKKDERWKIRSKTFSGLADAIANQWGANA